MSMKKIMLSSGIVVAFSLMVFLVNSNKEIIINNAGNKISKSEIHNWNSSYYSLSDEELHKAFYDKINSNEGKLIVVFYDGGRCNPYIENVLSEVKKIDNKYTKIVVTNYNQSYIDSMYHDDYSSSMLILGDENRYLGKDVGIYNSDSDRVKNVMLIYDGDRCLTKLEYAPRFEGSITQLIK